MCQLIIKQSNVTSETRITCAFECNFTTEKPSEILEKLRRDLSFGTDAELSESNYDILRSLFHQKIPNRAIIPLLISSRNKCSLTEEAKYADSIDQLLKTQSSKSDLNNYPPNKPYTINPSFHMSNATTSSPYNPHYQSDQNADII